MKECDYLSLNEIFAAKLIGDVAAAERMDIRYGGSMAADTDVFRQSPSWPISTFRSHRQCNFLHTTGVIISTINTRLGAGIYIQDYGSVVSYYNS